MEVDLTFESATGMQASAGERARSSAAWLALGGAFLFSMFWGSRSFGLQDNNEALYAEVAREMLGRGDWVVPHLNGLPYLEKPPVLYWLIAGLFRIFGEHEWVVRLGPALCFGGAIGAVIWIGRLAGSLKAGRNAALLLCSAAGIVVMGRSLLFDGPLMCVVAWTLAFFLRWRLTGSRWSLRACYALLGLGVMTKGALAIVLGAGAPVISTWVATWGAGPTLSFRARAARALRAIGGLWDWAGGAFFAAIAAPWHVLAARREPGFAEFYFINEHVRRFLGSREPHDFYTGPAYYYLERLPLYLGIWVFALLLLWPARERLLATAARPVIEARRLLGVVALVALAFFSTSEGKANYYLLSVMPPLALLLALAWPEDGVRSRRLLLGAGNLFLFAIVFGVAPLVFARKAELAPILRANQRLLVVVALVLGTLAVSTWLCARRGRNRAAFWAIAAGGLVMLLPLPPLLQAADPVLSQRELVRFLDAAPKRRVVLYRDYEKLSSAAFYLHRPVPVLESESNELYYAYHHHADRAVFLDAEAFGSLARSEPLWLVTTPRRADEALEKFSALAPRVVRRFPKAVVLLVEPPADAHRASVAGL